MSEIRYNDVRAALERSRDVISEHVRDSLDTFAVETDVSITRHTASALATTLESRYAKSAAELAPIIERLRLSDERQVLFCLAFGADRTLIAVLDVEASTALAAVLHDRKFDEAFIAADELRDRLKASKEPFVNDALKVLDPGAEDQRFQLHEQAASTTATALQVKYLLAQQKGFVIHGLNRFITRLTALGEATILLVNVDTAVGYTTVALSSAADIVIAAISVETVSGSASSDALGDPQR